MKKISILLLLLVTHLAAFAQSYIRVNAGYALPLNSQIVGVENNYDFDTNTGEETESNKAIYGSFGSGFAFQVAYGKSFGESTLGFDLEAGYVLGKEYKIKSAESEDGVITNRLTEKYSARSFQFSPSLTFTANTGKLKPYTRIGPVLAITKIRNGIIFADNTELELEFDYTGGISVGFKGALGVCFSPDSKIQFFTELSFTSLSASPKEGELTKFINDGENVLDDIPKEERKVKLKESYTIDDSTDEQVQIREKYSMGSLSIQVGVRFNLN